MSKRRADVLRAYLALVSMMLLLVSAGCVSRADEEGPTVTEMKRKLVGPKVWKYLVDAQKAYERGGYTLALALTDSAEQLAPDLADIHYLRGTIYTQLNQLGIAQAAYHIVLEHDPEYKGARFNLGLLEFRRLNLRDAIRWFEQERELESTSILELELGRVYAKLGEPDSARMAYEQALALDSTNATALMWLGQLHEELGEMDEALKVSRAGLRLRPDNIDYQYVVGSLLFRMGEVDEAKGYLSTVAAQRPWHHGAQFNMGQVLMREGKEEEAKAYFTRADSAQQMQQKITEAEEEIAREPQVLERWETLGSLLRQIGEVDKAIEAFKVATTLDPWNMHLQSNLALLMMEKGDMDSAIRRFEAVLSVDSTLADVWLNLGAAYANAGRGESAKAAWEKVIELRPGNRVARDYLAQLERMSATAQL